MSDLARVPRGLTVGLTGWLELVRRAIGEIRTRVYVWSTITGVALPNATWVAITPASPTAVGSSVSGTVMTVPPGFYVLDLYGAYVTSTTVEVGYSTDGSTWVSLWSDIPPQTSVPIQLSAESDLRIGLRATGAGTLSGGSFLLARVCQ